MLELLGDDGDNSSPWGEGTALLMLLPPTFPVFEASYRIAETSACG